MSRATSDSGVALLDIDHFKTYHDTLGHVAGDEAIRRVAKLLKESVRTSDTVYRYVGEEFLIVMPEMGGKRIDLVAQRIRQSVEQCAIPHPEPSVGPVVTISVGHTSVTRHIIQRLASRHDVIEEAGLALYRAKQSGRNAAFGSAPEA